MAETGVSPRLVVQVVDDAPDALGFLVTALEAAGCSVLVARSGEAALAALELVVPDAILLDAVMPGLDGFETCRRIKALPGRAHVPVIFMTALSETSHVVAGFEAGGVDYVVKPLKIDEVLARLSTHVRNARLSRQAQQAGGPAPARFNQRVRAAELTPREAEVLSWLAKGKTNRDIAEILGMSPRTVNKHLEHVYAKLGVETRTSAAALAREQD